MIFENKEVIYKWNIEHFYILSLFRNNQDLKYMIYIKLI